ncbi:hypothetical protein [Falsiroseomonas sp. E2-1-a20]|uniref:hypothetical protein n=1 Tax=Falsiroseomonas sp. E2-1-a20 TaxID=3239300 RepID=UPI003F39C412
MASAALPERGDARGHLPDGEGFRRCRAPATATDLITDFSQAEADLIDLGGIDADPLTAGNQAFTDLGTGAFTGAVGQLRHEGDGAGNTLVLADIDGDAVADLVVRLSGTLTLTTSDFIL